MRSKRICTVSSIDVQESGSVRIVPIPMISNFHIIDFDSSRLRLSGQERDAAIAIRVVMLVLRQNKNTKRAVTRQRPLTAYGVLSSG